MTDPKQPQPARRLGRHVTPRNVLRALAVWLWFATFAGLYHLVPNIPRATLHHERRVFLECFSPDGKTLVTTAAGSKNDEEVPIYVWDLESRQQRFTRTKKFGWIKGHQISADGKYLLDHQGEAAVLWDARTGAELAAFRRDFWQDYVIARLSPDGRFLLYEAGPSTVAVWELETKQVRAEIKGNLRNMRFDRGGKRLALVTGAGGKDSWKVSVWELGAAENAATLCVEHHVRADEVTVSPTLDYFATATYDAHTHQTILELWDVETGRSVSRANHPVADIGVVLPVFSPAGGFLLALAQKPAGGVTIFDVKRGMGHKFMAAATPDLSADERWIITWAKGFQVVEMATGQRPFELLGPDESVHSPVAALFAPDSKTLVVTNISTNRKPQPLMKPFSRFINLNETHARLWALETGREMAVFDDCHDAVYSADGKTLATAHEDGTVRVWDLPVRKPLLSILGTTSVLWLGVLVGLQCWGQVVRWKFRHFVRARSVSEGK
jgi:WD40 repeat protein